MKINIKKAGIIAGIIVASPVVFVLGFFDFLVNIVGYLIQGLIRVGAILTTPFLCLHAFLKGLIDG